MEFAQSSGRDRISVILIEDNRLVREGLAALFVAEPDLELVAALESGAIGLQQIQERKPQIVLVDATLSNRSSHRLVETLRTAAPETRVIVMDLLPAHQDVIQFVEAGAHGFIVKEATLQDFMATIRTVAAGGQVVPASLSGTLLTHIAIQAVGRQLPGVAESVRLTRREREVMDLIAEGLSNKEIARRTNLSTNTVKSHVHNILEKLALRSRLQIATLALKNEPASETYQ